MKFSQSLREQVDKGRAGQNWGLSMGLPKIEGITDGVCQETYTLLFADTGAGKTSFTLYAYIYKPLMENKGKPFNIIYYSLEMSGPLLLAKLAVMYIFDKYGVELSVKEIISKKRQYTLSDEHYEMVLDALEWLDEIENVLTIYDKGLNADILYAHLLTEMKKYGTFHESENSKYYILNDPDQIVQVVIDHLGKTRAVAGRSKKEEMDLVSSYLTTIRNRCKISPLVLMQMNRTAKSMDRRTNGFSEPQLDDIKETGSPSEDAEIILALYHAHREKQGTYRKYRVSELRDVFRGVLCLKNRYGESETVIGCAFYGKTGIWKELPLPEEITDYEPYTQLIHNKINKQEDVKTEDKLTYNFTL